MDFVQKTIIVDIDETVCSNPVSDPSIIRDYHDSRPIHENIQKVNEMYDAGHHIIYWTARGSRTKIDWRSLTESQLKAWGAKYHELRLGKPHYDIWIDDKAINSIHDWNDKSILRFFSK